MYSLKKKDIYFFFETTNDYRASVKCLPQWRYGKRFGMLNPEAETLESLKDKFRMVTKTDSNEYFFVENFLSFRRFAVVSNRISECFAISKYIDSHAREFPQPVGIYNDYQKENIKLILNHNTD